ncbi:unnamed protein product [Adineta ricciae]|uniref:Uncharacterized protein n=2 Tax=Adineta ricciae TaxID=249248 RepID=A0A814PA60_ADIRI|nr:unnamed protein product [Adineta ricciae]
MLYLSDQGRVNKFYNMSFSTKSYSKESRSSSHYSRSSSYHASTNNGCSSSYASHSFTDDRPLSTRLIERDCSCPSLAWQSDFDDPFFFDRLRWRFDNDLFNYNYGLGRPIPITYRRWNNYSTRSIPIQRISSTSNVRRYRKSDNDDYSSSFIKRHDESSMRRENRITSDDWPPKREPPTRKRSSLTIFVQQPFIDQCDLPYYRQTPRTPTYPNSSRFEYY